MAKFEEVFEETQDLYDKAIMQTGLGNQINITILANNKAKEIFKVNKANELLKFRSGDDVIIVINENILEKLSPEQREIVVEESLASISWDSEKDKLVITKPDVVTHSLLLKKIGFEKYFETHETIKLLFASEKQSEEEAAGVIIKA